MIYPRFMLLTKPPIAGDDEKCQFIVQIDEIESFDEAWIAENPEHPDEGGMDLGTMLRMRSGKEHIVTESPSNIAVTLSELKHVHGIVMFKHH